ncbi:MAG: hypothetical protein JOY62_11715 [Acidobacteriaceae bacterium]|nr:hypothetical protein [Acidobacteriaceae bacterium]MBV9780627.1 hypothetical protein [Acidobacteriaceae bacterium]
MFRAIFELLITILVVIVARAILTSLVKNFSRVSSNPFQYRAPNQRSGAYPANSAPDAHPGGELHKDPVCGTYVAESTPFHRQISGQSFYYCSEACREKHALVAR